jgi:hypothetical protein
MTPEAFSGIEPELRPYQRRVLPEHLKAVAGTGVSPAVSGLWARRVNCFTRPLVADSRIERLSQPCRGRVLPLDESAVFLFRIATSEIESDKQAYETCVGTSRSRQNGRWRN